MFTCSSCGYEANPDSAPACSLCGTKRPGKAGASKDADAPKAAPAPAPVASSASAAKSAGPKTPSPAPAKAAPAKAPPAKKPAGDGLDELAAAVADSADAPVTTDRGAKGRTARGAGGERGAVVTTAGILRLSTPPPQIENALTVMGAFVGTVAGYAIEWRILHHAPAALSEIWIAAALAAGGAALARLFLSPILENKLTFQAKEAVHGPLAGLTGGLFAILALVGFFAASRVAEAPVDTKAGKIVLGAPGELLAQRMALLTPWTVTLKTDKYVVLNLKGKPEIRIPLVKKLDATDVADVQKKTGYALTELDRFTSGDPSPLSSSILPPEFSVDVFIDKVSNYDVLPDTTPRKNDLRQGRLLVRHRKSGPDELLAIPAAPRAAGEIETALPAHVPLWIGISFGIPHDSTPDHDAFVATVLDKYRPQD